MGIMNILTKVVIIVEIILSLAKTFVFMRIVLGFSYIVTMIVNVVSIGVFGSISEPMIASNAQ